MEIIYVHLGSEFFPSYLNDSIVQSRLWNPCNKITVICSKKYKTLVSNKANSVIFTESLPKTQLHKTFLKQQTYNIKFRNGFWLYTTERLYVLHDYCVFKKVNSFVHLENDNLLYTSIDIFSKCSNNHIYAPYFGDNKITFGILISHNGTDVIGSMLDFFNTTNLWSDAMILGHEYFKANQNVCSFLPSSLNGNIKRYESPFPANGIEKWQGIFDPAQYGQWIGGIDPRNGESKPYTFVNETAIYPPDQFIYKVDKIFGNYQIFVGLKNDNFQNEQIWYPIYLLHIHSKYLSKYTSDRLKIESKLFDIVIPLGPNDICKIQNQIKYTKKNIVGYRNIYLVTKLVKECVELKLDDCIIIDESVFPFTIKDVENSHTKQTRNGWYLQQLLKLYAGRTIPGILGLYLTIDADTFFVKPVSFINDSGKPLFNYGTEYHRPYFDHMNLMHTSLTKIFPDKSGICHHMLFDRECLDQLFKLVEVANGSKNFWEIFLDSVAQCNRLYSGASEYEIYFNFMLKYHSDKILIRKLNWINTGSSDLLSKNTSYDYISMHWYMR